MSDASDIFERLIIMMLMGEMSGKDYKIEVGGANPMVSIDEAEICKAEKMYEEKESN
tara:strand:+ start:874 stop:1044 length:171 start_codon:yes stop_codon:yes gene_type:complete